MDTVLWILWAHNGRVVAVFNVTLVLGHWDTALSYFSRHKRGELWLFLKSAKAMQTHGVGRSLAIEYKLIRKICAHNHKTSSSVDLWIHPHRNIRENKAINFTFL